MTRESNPAISSLTLRTTQSDVDSRVWSLPGGFAIVFGIFVIILVFLRVLHPIQVTLADLSLVSSVFAAALLLSIALRSAKYMVRLMSDEIALECTTLGIRWRRVSHLDSTSFAALETPILIGSKPAHLIVVVCREKTFRFGIGVLEEVQNQIVDAINQAITSVGGTPEDAISLMRSTSVCGPEDSSMHIRGLIGWDRLPPRDVRPSQLVEIPLESGDQLRLPFLWSGPKVWLTLLGVIAFLAIGTATAAWMFDVRADAFGAVLVIVPGSMCVAAMFTFLVLIRTAVVIDWQFPVVVVTKSLWGIPLRRREIFIQEIQDARVVISGDADAWETLSIARKNPRTIGFPLSSKFHGLFVCDGGEVSLVSHQSENTVRHVMKLVSDQLAAFRKRNML